VSQVALLPACGRRWRFRILGKETVAKIIALNDAKAELFEGVPGWLMVSVVPTAGDAKWNPKALEDHAATACAVQNFMLSLAGEGYASKWMTGAMGIPPTKLMELAGADEATEHYMGVIFFGRPASPTATMAVPKRKSGARTLRLNPLAPGSDRARRRRAPWSRARLTRRPRRARAHLLAVIGAARAAARRGRGRLCTLDFAMPLSAFRCPRWDRRAFKID
jgi:hypothetical protein